MDTVDEQTRSRIMASVKRQDTGPEMVLRRILHRMGLRYRLHVKNLPGSPDLVFPKYKAVIFVHGCFWHVHEGCKYSTRPASRSEFWEKKFERNVLRDRKNYEALANLGWKVLVVWECAIKNLSPEDSIRLSRTIVFWLQNEAAQYHEIGG